MDKATVPALGAPTNERRKTMISIALTTACGVALHVAVAVQAVVGICL